MSLGYLYCFSNESMPNIIKIGMTERNLKLRLNEANASDTWRPPTPYKIEFAKKVVNPKDKEKTIHYLLTKYTKRINPKREFFQISINEVKEFFKLINGNFIYHTHEDTHEDTYENNNKNTMRQYFKNEQKNRHKIRIKNENKEHILNGIYDYKNNIIMSSDNNSFTSLSGFAMYHYSLYNKSRQSANGWIECECYFNDNWIKINQIKKMIQFN